MSCDIHLYVERFADGKWQTADKWTEEDGEKLVDADDMFYYEQDQYVFAALGHEFFAEDTGVEPVIPSPRGLPADMCPEVKGAHEEWEGDAYGETWFLLSELLGHAWSDDCEDFRDEVLPRLKAFGEPDKVRIVVWFDN